MSGPKKRSFSEYHALAALGVVWVVAGCLVGCARESVKERLPPFVEPQRPAMETLKPRVDCQKGFEKALGVAPGR